MAPFLALTLIVGGCDRQSAPAPQQEAVEKAAPAPAGEGSAATYTVDRAQKGEAMPTLPFETADGAKITLAAFKGRPVLVNLWATWCGPCVVEMPLLEKLAAREANALQVIAISQDMKGRAAVDPWWSKQGFTMLQPYLDATADLSFKLGGGSLPMTVLYDADGREVWRLTGALDWTGAEAKALIGEAG